MKKKKKNKCCAGTSVTQKGDSWCEGNRREFTSGWCCAGKCNRGDCCNCISSCASCRVECYNRNYRQLCLKNNLVDSGENRCHNIWHEDWHDARVWLYNEYKDPLERNRQDYNAKYGFSDGNIDDLHYPK